MSNRNKKMVTRKTWEEFRDTGLLIIINQILHIFGWAIVFEFDGDKLIGIYPARVKFRGFSSESVSKGYLLVSKYLMNNATKLYDETKNEYLTNLIENEAV